MRYFLTTRSRWTAVMAAALVAGLIVTAPAGTARAAAPYEAIVRYDWAQGRAPLAPVEEAIRAAKTPEARRAIEDRLIATLQVPGATYAGKQFVCRMLRRVGSARCVPALAALLADERLAHMARFALQQMPEPEAGAALRAALGKVRGDLKLGVIASLGERGEPEAVPLLAPLAASQDEALARAAIRALARIGGKAAAEALGRLSPPASLEPAWADACLRTADDLAEAGDVAAAVRLYKRFTGADQPLVIRMAAVRGLARAQKAEAVPMLLEMLGKEKGALRSPARP